MHKSKFITYITAVVLTVGIGAALAVASNWVPPTEEPVAGNTPAPINVGSTAQTKKGSLSVEGLIVATTTTGGVQFPDGTIQKTAFSGWSKGEGCYPIVGNKCLAGYYMNGVSTCCPLDPNIRYTPGIWKVDQLAVSYPYSRSYENGYWSPAKKDSFITEFPINKIRIKGSSDDGGFCYVYWGTGHAKTGRNIGAVGISIVDGKWYNNCPFGNGTFDDNGNVKICATHYDSGGMPTVTNDVVIPAGATVTLQGRYVNGFENGYLNCSMDFQYGP